MGIAFLAGFIYITTKALHLLYIRFKDSIHDEKLYMYFLLLAWFIFMLAPEFLTAEGLPHALRAIGTIPVVMIFATVPFLWIMGKIPSYGYSLRIFSLSLLAGAFIFIGVFNTVKYFVYFNNNTNQHKAFDMYLVDISRYFSNLSPSTEKYLITDQYTSQPIRFLNTNTENMFFVWDVHVPYINPKTNRFVIISTHPTEEINEILLEKFPELKIYKHEKTGGEFYLEFRSF